MSPIRVLVVDDNLPFLRAEVDLLTEEFNVVASLSDGSQVVAEVVELKPDVVVLDIALGNVTGFEIARRLMSVGVDAHIVFLTIYESEEFVQAAIELGAAGYVFKSQAAHDLPKAIIAAFRGEKFFPTGTLGEYR